MKIPNLLPLAYCTLDRAAKMLACTIDDLIHWGSIGAIELCCRLNELPVFMLVFDDKYQNISWSPIEECFPFTPLSTANFDEVKLSPSHYGSIFGFWPIIAEQIALIEEHKSISLILSNYLLSFHEGLQVLCIVNELSSDEDVYITKNDLWITFDNLKKIYDAIYLGAELPNIYNNSELAKKGRKSQQKQSSGRVTNKQFSMIKSLIQLNKNIKNELIDRPYELFSVLEKMFAKEKIPCPVSDGNTLKEWLD